MCGIAGAAWTSHGQALETGTLRAMTDALVHRGPDDEGHWRNNYPDGSGVALGFRRLSIIDLEGGHQPLANEDETIWIAFNGEVYNGICNCRRREVRCLRPSHLARQH